MRSTFREVLVQVLYLNNYILKEQDEDVVITLVAKNPQAPKNKIRYDHNKGEWHELKLVERMIDHLHIDSTCIHKDSAEGKKQLQVDGGVKEIGKVMNCHLSLITNSLKSNLFNLYKYVNALFYPIRHL